MLAELNKFNCLHFCGLLKFNNLLLTETKMLIVREELLVFLRFSFFSFNLCQLLLTIFIILPYELFWKPSVISPRHSHIMNVILILGNISLLALFFILFFHFNVYATIILIYRYCYCLLSITTLFGVFNWRNNWFD